MVNSIWCRMTTLVFVPLEAMAACKPVIACNSVGPVESIKNGETGLLCNPTPEEFSSAMARFIQHDKLAEQMGQSSATACGGSGIILY